MGSGHSLVLGIQNDPHLDAPSQTDSDIQSASGMEMGSQASNATLQLPQQSSQHDALNDITGTSLEQGSHPNVAVMRAGACQLKDIALTSDTSSEPVRDDSAVPNFVSETIEQSPVTEPETVIETTTYDKIRAAIRKDLQSGRLEIPPHKPVQNVDAPTENPARFQFPPALMSNSSQSRHRQRFDRSPLLPDRNLPFCAQVMEHVKDWAEWGTKIADEQRRKEVLDHVFDVLSKAWLEALRMGYKPGTTDTKTRAPQVSTKRSAQREDEIPAGLPRGKPRSKRETSPSKMPILVADHRDGLAWAVTAGELEEAGISESQIRKRAAAKNTLEVGDKLLARVLQDYGGRIQPSDWHKIMDVTRLNPMGRDLMVYCLYEVLNVRNHLAQLRGYYNHFNTVRQKENTQRRIDNDQERHDLFMALALELDEENAAPDEPTTPSPSTSHEGSVVVPPATDENETDASDQLDVLIRLSKTILHGTDNPSISSSFELFGISHDDLATDDSIEGTSSIFDQCKHILKDLLLKAREWLTLTKDARLGVEENLIVDMPATVLEIQIRQEKEKLNSLLPSLMAEQEAIKKSVDRSRASTWDHSDAASTTTMQTDDMMRAQDKSRASSQNAAKHHLDAADEEDPLPPTKKPKADHERDHLGHPDPTLDDRPAIRNIHEASTPDNQDGLDVSSGSHSNTASKFLRRCLIVRLRIPTHFSPANFTSRRVFCHPSGFRFRYTSESTLAQRRSFTEALETYIKTSVEKDTGRFGRYKVVADPNDPEMKPVVHGVWDLEDGSPPTGREWFSSGDGRYPSVQKDVSAPQDAEGEEALRVPPPVKKKSVVLLKFKNPSLLRQQGSCSIADDNAITTGPSAPVKTPNAAGPQQGKNKKQNNKGRYRHVRFSAEQPTAAHKAAEQSLSVDRPKRRIAQRKSYAEEDDDDDYSPSD